MVRIGEEDKNMNLNDYTYTTIAIDKRPNGVAIATLNRPDRLNAVNGTMHHELSHICRNADADPDVKVLVFTGAGRSFCAGGDFSKGSETTHKITLEDARMIVDNLLEAHIPIISAVNGYAMGLGATLALLCDIVVAGEGATFADTHVTMGIGAGDGGQVIWPFLMGINRAKYYLMTGDRIKAAEAERLGLVNFVVPDDELMDKALEIADRLAAGPGRAIAASKVPINNWLRTVSAQVLTLSLSREGAMMRSSDAKEAARAFAEKRTPEFKGR